MSYNAGYQPPSGMYSNTYNQARNHQSQSVSGTPSSYVANSLGFAAPSEYQQINYQQYSNLNQPATYQHVQPNVGVSSNVYQTPVNPSSVQPYNHYQGSQQIYQTPTSSVYDVTPQSTNMYNVQHTAPGTNPQYQPPAPHSIHSSRQGFKNVANTSYHKSAMNQYTPKVYKPPQNTVYSSNKVFKPPQNNKGITTVYSSHNSFHNRNRFPNQSNRNDHKFGNKSFLNNPRNRNRHEKTKKEYSCENVHPVSALKQLFPDSKFETVCDYQIKGNGAFVVSVTVNGATYQGEATSPKIARAFAAANALKSLKAKDHDKLFSVADVEEQKTCVLSIIQQWQENQAKKISIKRKGSESLLEYDQEVAKKVKIEEPSQNAPSSPARSLSLLKKIYGHDISEEMTSIQSKPTVIFLCTLTVQGFKFEGQGGSKKKSRAIALDVCFDEFEKNPPPYVKKDDNPDKKVAQRVQKTFADKIAAKCWDFVTETLEPALEAYKKKKNIVAIVKMEGEENEENVENCEVVSFGTGTRLIGMQNLTKDGTVIKDSTGDSLALRGLRRYLMHQIEECINENVSIYVKQEDGKFKVKEGIQFIFYTNNCPNGDCRLLPRRSSENTIKYLEEEALKKAIKPETAILSRYDPQSFDNTPDPVDDKPGESEAEPEAVTPELSNITTVYSSYKADSRPPRGGTGTPECPAPVKMREDAQPAAAPSTSEVKKTTYSIKKSNETITYSAVVANPVEASTADKTKPNRRNRQHIRTKEKQDFGKITYDTRDEKLGSLEITQQFNVDVTHVIPSPSDKLALRNVTGVQGSMLASISHPVYISQYLITMRFGTESQYRALFNRVQGTDLPVTSPYKIDKPLLRRPHWKATLFPDKTSMWGNIWCKGFKVETLYTLRGQKVPTTEVPVKVDGVYDSASCNQSSYSTNSLFEEFILLCAADKVDCVKNYKDLKYANSEYNKIKQNVKNHLKKNGHGEWIDHDFKYTF